LFEGCRDGAAGRLEAKADLVTAPDDSLLRKRGSKIHGVRFQRDPLSPPFHVNLVRGLRVLQTSAALPQPGGGARMVPIDFAHAVLPAKPRKSAPKPEWQAHKQTPAQSKNKPLGQERPHPPPEEKGPKPRATAPRPGNGREGP